jgi:hypothetical protein
MKVIRNWLQNKHRTRNTDLKQTNLFHSPACFSPVKQSSEGIINTSKIYQSYKIDTYIPLLADLVHTF